MIQNLFYFIRHGESEANAKAFRSGQMDVPLTEKGREEVRALIPLLLDLSPQPQRIITSTLCRAYETAEMINAYLRLPLTRNKGLCEQHYGDLQGRELKWIRQQYGDQDDIAPPNGETFVVFQQRILKTLQNILALDQGIPLIVGHGGMMNAFRNFLGLPYEKVSNGAVFFWDGQKLILKN